MSPRAPSALRTPGSLRAGSCNRRLLEATREGGPAAGRLRREPAGAGVG